MHVIKRNGKTETIKFDKVTARIEKLSYSLSPLVNAIDVAKKVIEGIRQLHAILKVNKVFKQSDEALGSYDVAHHAGLSLNEEYELLQIMQELQRQEYLRQHLLKVLPVLAEMETLKDRIQLNGHFKNLSGFDL